MKVAWTADKMIGLGDAVMVAHMLEYYRGLGYDVEVNPGRYSEIYDWAGIPCSDEAHPDIWYQYKEWVFNRPRLREWTGNRTAHALRMNPPHRWDWATFSRTRLKPVVPEAVREKVRGWLAPLGRPWIVYAPRGTSWQTIKNQGDDFVKAMTYALGHLGSVVTLDQDMRVPRTAANHLRHSANDFGRLSVGEIIALVEAADLVVGADTGPYHVGSEYLGRPSVLLGQGFYPSCVCLPRPNATLLYKPHPMHQHREGWNIREWDGTAAQAAQVCGQILTARPVRRPPPADLTIDRLDPTDALRGWHAHPGAKTITIKGTILDGHWTGAGSLLMPNLLKKGWRIVWGRGDEVHLQKPSPLGITPSPGAG